MKMVEDAIRGIQHVLQGVQGMAWHLNAWQEVQCSARFIIPNLAERAGYGWGDILAVQYANTVL